MVALALRLVSYATNVGRVIVALALGATLWSLIVSTGIVAGSGTVLGMPPGTLLAIALAALVVDTLWLVANAHHRDRGTLEARVIAIAERLLGRRPEDGPADEPGPIASRYHKAGTWLARSRPGTRTSPGSSPRCSPRSSSRSPRGSRSSRPPTRAMPPPCPAPHRSRFKSGPSPERIARAAGPERGNLALAKAYMPVLAFTEDQRWAPTGVESYLDPRDPKLPNAQLTGPVSTRARTASRGAHARICDPARLVTPCEPRTLAGLPRECPGLASTPCYRLTIACAAGSGPCAKARPRRPRTKPYHDGTVYVRVLGRNHADRGSTADVFRDVGPFRTGQKDVLWMVVQYWYFYRYDEWAQRVLPGTLVQRHEGDWEVVTVGLSKDRPLFVGYSAHCAGTWRAWTPSESRRPRPVARGHIPSSRSPRARRPTTRRPVSVARRSGTRCAGIPAITAGLVSYAANVRDRTGHAWQWTPRRIVPVTDKDAPMSFPGRWGAYDETRLVNNADLAPLSRGRGPATPTLQPLWQDPVGTIFCDARWTGPDPWRSPKRSLCASQAPVVPAPATTMRASVDQAG